MENENQTAAAPEQPEAEPQDQAPDSVGELQAKLAAKEKEAGDLRQDHLRALADLENYKKRAAREKAEIYKNSMASVLLEVLPVLDNLERAVAAAKGGNKEQNIEN